MKCSLLALSSYLDGELDAARRAEVEAHLVGCDRCRRGSRVPPRGDRALRRAGAGPRPRRRRPRIPPAARPDRARRHPPPAAPPAPGAARPPGRRRRALARSRFRRPGPALGADPQPRAPGGRPPDSNQPSLPFTDSLAARGLRLVRRADPDASESFDIQLRGRSLEVPPPPRHRSARGARESAEPVMSPADRESRRRNAPEPASMSWHRRRRQQPGASAGAGSACGISASGAGCPRRLWRGLAATGRRPRRGLDLAPGERGPRRRGEGLGGRLGGSPPVEGTPAPSPDPARPGTIWDGITYSPPPSEARERLGGAPPRTPLPDSIPLTSSPPPWLAPTPEPSPPSWQTPTPRSAQPAPPPPPPPPPPGSGAPPPPTPPAVPAWRPPSRVDPPGSSAREDDPWSWAPRDDAPPPPARVPPPPASPPGAPDHLPRSAAADPTWPLGGPDAPPEPDGSDQDAAPDPLIDSVIARAARPPQPVPTTLISRLRDQVALRLALRRGAGAAAEDTAGDTAVAGQEAAGRPATRGFDRAAGGRDAIAHGPAQRGVSVPPSRLSRPPPPRGLRARTGPNHRHGTRCRSAPPPSPRSCPGRPPPPGCATWIAARARSGRHTRRLGESRHRAGGAGGSVAQMAARFGELPHQVRRLAAHPRRRWLLVAGLAALVLIVSLVVIHPGAPSPVARPLTTPAPVASLQPSLAPGDAACHQPRSRRPRAPRPSARRPPRRRCRHRHPWPRPRASGAGAQDGRSRTSATALSRTGTQWIVIDFSGGTGEPRATACASPARQPWW